MKHNDLSRHCAPRLLIGFIVLVWAVACAPAPSKGPGEATPLTIVFVHGAWGGGWQFHKVQPLLEEAGFTVYRPTMTFVDVLLRVVREENDSD